VESIAISTHKSWDLAKLVDLEVLGRDALCRIGFNDLELDVVCLGNCLDRSGSRIFLREIKSAS
jgi:hypothetical protein